MRNLIFGLLCAFMASCVATHNGIVASSSSSKPVKYVDIAFGVAKSDRFFGLGGISQDALTLEAKRSLMRNRPLEEDEEYANFTTDYKRTYFPFLFQTKVTLSADVVVPRTEKGDIYSEKYRRQLASVRGSDQDFFSPGDTVVDKRNKEGVILSLEKGNVARILLKTRSGKFKTKKMALMKLFANKRSHNGRHIGERYAYTRRRDRALLTGRIVGFGIKEVLIRKDSKSLMVLPYGRVPSTDIEE